MRARVDAHEGPDAHTRTDRRGLVDTRERADPGLGDRLGIEELGSSSDSHRWIRVLDHVARAHFRTGWHDRGARVRIQERGEGRRVGREGQIVSTCGIDRSDSSNLERVVTLQDAADDLCQASERYAHVPPPSSPAPIGQRSAGAAAGITAGGSSSIRRTRSVRSEEATEPPRPEATGRHDEVPAKWVCQPGMLPAGPFQKGTGTRIREFAPPCGRSQAQRRHRRAGKPGDDAGLGRTRSQKNSDSCA